MSVIRTLSASATMADMLLWSKGRDPSDLHIQLSMHEIDCQLAFFQHGVGNLESAKLLPDRRDNSLTVRVMRLRFFLWCAPFVLFFALLGILKTIQFCTYVHYENLGDLDDVPSARPARLRLLHFNVFWRPRLIHPFDNEYMSDRSLLLLDQIRDYDVVCLNEAFQFGSHIVDTFVNKSEDFGFRYVVSGATVPLLSRKVLDSGVLILSKYPILVTDAVVFEDGCSYDSFAAKGAVYAQIGVGRDRRIHIFASHLQASYRVVTEVDFGVRKSQSRDVKALVAKWAAQSRPGDPIILLGDMNIDSIGEQEEYTQLMQTLALPGYDLIDTLKSKGHPVTLAASEEGQSEPIERFLTLKEDWGYQQSIDYIFLYEPVNAPVFARYEAETRKFAVSGRVYQQLSDHIGVECFVEFA